MTATWQESKGAQIKIVTKNFGVADSHKIGVYQQRGGYEALRRALTLQPAALVDEVKKSNLRGRGGAGFPTGMKWSFIPKDAKLVYLVVNADESEPGTCKDRELLAYDPHMLLEGMLIASYALGCKHAYIYIRGEMMREAKVVQGAIDEAYAAGWLGKEHPAVGGGGAFKLDVTLHRGAGAYICGEETGLLNSLEGKRGWPRLKPPFPAIKGLFDAPTVVNNVETIMNIPEIITKGGEWFAGLGMGKSGGTRIVCVSGHVNKPGVFELPMGITFRDLIYDVCGGIPNGRQLKGVIPGGSSMPPLDASELDVPCEFDALMTDPRIKDVEVRPGVPFDLGGGRKLKTMAGSGGIVVFDDSTDVVALCARIMQFYAHESCGQCTPCREGSGWLSRVCKRLARGEGEAGDVELLANIANGIGGNTICALGDAAAWPMLGFLTKFRADFEARIKPKTIGIPAAAKGGGGVISTLMPEGASAGDVVVFWILAAMVTFFAVFTITRKNPVTAVMSLVGTFFGLAAMYATLSAHFLAVLQVLVYAGAITVLFIFVVMILNREEVTPLSFRPLRVLGVLAGVYLFVKVVDIVAVGMPTVVPPAPSDTFGTVAAVGDLLFRDFLYPFEAISILLLVAIVGGVVISRSHQKEVAANVAADQRKQIHEMSSHDYPGATEEPAPEGHH